MSAAAGNAGLQPLAGLRVVDASQGIAGPYCGEILRLWGAEVVKVEPPAGDWGRGLGAGAPGATAIAIANNYGKRALCLDTGKAAARAALLRLAAGCDLFLESFRPGVIARLGAGYDAVSARNAAVVYVSISGFGQDGPYAGKPATDTVVQALAGMMVMNRDPGGTPRRVGMYAVDTVTGLYAANAAMAALIARGRSGRGARLDISLYNAAAAFQGVPIMDDAINAGRAPVPLVVPSGIFETADGYVNLAALNDDMFFRIAEAIGRDEWKSDPRYASNASRAKLAAEINLAVADALRTRSTDAWLYALEQADALCAPVLDYAAMLDDPQMAHAGFMQGLAQPGIGELPIAALPGTVASGTAPPLAAVGADTRAVLADYGFDAAEVEALVGSGAAVQA